MPRNPDENTTTYNGITLNSVASLAYILGYHPEYIRQLRRKGKIFGTKIKGAFWYDLNDTRDRILGLQDFAPANFAPKITPKTIAEPSLDPNYDV